MTSRGQPEAPQQAQIAGPTAPALSKTFQGICKIVLLLPLEISRSSITQEPAHPPVICQLLIWQHFYQPDELRFSLTSVRVPQSEPDGDD